ncbi:uncharacterized protein LOC118183798 [Stegodyphus dumicola]|uniref:uncharacterized protein LOC118183798 n=1 Tax=Stegodyphus dumicola TaxID=202533 RepID=UPI0015ADFAC2|nr:uncharacterized protein LOC118183798 [Stegodyphus dumicola]
MHCLCSVPVDYRLYKINCMERFVSPDNAFTLARSVQYCGYFAYKTNFGQTMRQGVNIQDYNPWEPASDLNTEKICGYTYIRPDIYMAPSIQAVTSKGWVISKCILNMAKIDGTTARTMLQECC